jgi:DNA transformation protein
MKTDSLRDFVTDQLRLPGLECRSMFGGYGLYSNERIFGILFKGRLYFKTNATTRSTYEQRGMKPFRPNVRQRLNSYYEVPADVIEDAPTLTAWATHALNPRDD